jgi:pilus assembly protein Flp/PilA
MNIRTSGSGYPNKKSNGFHRQQVAAVFEGDFQQEALKSSKPDTEGGQQMKKMLMKCRELIQSEEGATATEYAVMLALIIIVAIGAITFLGKKVNNTFQNIAESLPDPS